MEAMVLRSTRKAALGSLRIVAAGVTSALLLVLAACASAPQTTTPPVIYVSPDGSDATGNGTAAAPYRSLTKAVSVIPADFDAISLRNGSYTPATGEVFPIDVSGLTIQGQSRAGTVIGGSTAGVGLVATSASTSLQQLTIQGFASVAVDIGAPGSTRAQVELHDVAVRDNAGDGIKVRNADVTIRASLLRANGDENLDIEANADVTVTATTIEDAGDHNVQASQAGDATATVTLRITASTISGAGDRNVDIRSSAVATIVDSTISGSTRDNIGVSANGSLSVTGSSISGSARDGIDFDASGTLFVRTSTITDNSRYGISIGTNSVGAHPASVDLGNATAFGANILTGNTVFQLLDDRAAGAPNAIKALGNDFGANVFGLR
jgi:hypothetical protein